MHAQCHCTPATPICSVSTSAATSLVIIGPPCWFATPFRTRVLVVHEANVLDGPVLLKLFATQPIISSAPDLERTRVLVVHEADVLDGPVLLEFALQLALRHVVRQAGDKERLEGIALRWEGGGAQRADVNGRSVAHIVRQAGRKERLEGIALRCRWRVVWL